MIRKKYYILIDEEGRVYIDKGKYKTFDFSDEIKNYMFYSDPKKMPSWKDRYNIKEIELILNG